MTFHAFDCTSSNFNYLFCAVPAWIMFLHNVLSQKVKYQINKARWSRRTVETEDKCNRYSFFLKISRRNGEILSKVFFFLKKKNKVMHIRKEQMHILILH